MLLGASLEKLEEEYKKVAKNYGLEWKPESALIT